MKTYTIDDLETDAAAQTQTDIAAAQAQLNSTAPDTEIIAPEMDAEFQDKSEKTARQFAKIMAKGMDMAFKRSNKTLTTQDDKDDLQEMFEDVFVYHPAAIKSGRIMTYLGLFMVPTMIIADHMDGPDLIAQEAAPEKLESPPPPEHAKAPEAEILPMKKPSGRGLKAGQE